MSSSVEMNELEEAEMDVCMVCMKSTLDENGDPIKDVLLCGDGFACRVIYMGDGTPPRRTRVHVFRKMNPISNKKVCNIALFLLSFQITIATHLQN